MSLRGEWKFPWLMTEGSRPLLVLNAHCHGGLIADRRVCTRGARRATVARGDGIVPQCGSLTIWISGSAVSGKRLCYTVER